MRSFEEAQEVLFAAQTLSIGELIRACTRFCVLQMTGFESDFWPVLDSILKDQLEPYQLSVKLRDKNLRSADVEFFP